MSGVLDGSLQGPGKTAYSLTDRFPRSGVEKKNHRIYLPFFITRIEGRLIPEW
jgi:hypothetical protein